MKVREADGTVWVVSRQWMPRYEGRGFRSRAGPWDRVKHRLRWLEFFDLPFDIEALAVVLAIVAAALAFFLFGLPLLLALVDVIWVLLVAVIGLATRVLFRRPWTIEAESSNGKRLTRQVIGWRAGTRAIRELAAELARP